MAAEAQEPLKVGTPEPVFGAQFQIRANPVVVVILILPLAQDSFTRIQSRAVEHRRRSAEEDILVEIDLVGQLCGQSKLFIQSLSRDHSTLTGHILTNRRVPFANSADSLDVLVVPDTIVLGVESA